MASLFESIQNVRALFRRPRVPDTVAPIFEDWPDKWYAHIRQQQELPYERTVRYKDYQEMEGDAWVSAAIDIYAEEATVYDKNHGAAIWIKTMGDDKFAALMEDEWEIFADRIDLDERLPAVARDLAKYGDEFQRTLYDIEDPQKGILGVQYVDPHVVERLEDKFGRLKGYKTTSPAMAGANIYSGGASGEAAGGGRASGSKDWKPWDFCHMRIPGRKDLQRYEGGKYGMSLIESARRIWKTLAILEDSMLIYRLHRAPGIRVFYIDVGTVSYVEALQIAKLYRRVYNIKQYVNPRTGEYVARHNPLAMSNEDIYFPVRTNSNSRIELLPGGGDVNAIMDIDYFRKKMFAALKIPAGYLAHEEGLGGWAGQSTLAQQDVRFARTVKKLQHAIISGYTTLFQIHLALRDIPFDGKNFEIVMSPISTLEERDRLEGLELALQVAENLIRIGAEFGLDRVNLAKYVLTNVLSISDEELLTMGFDPKLVMVPTPEDKMRLKIALNGLLEKDEGLKEKLTVIRDKYTGLYEDNK